MEKKKKKKNNFPVHLNNCLFYTNKHVSNQKILSKAMVVFVAISSKYVFT